MEELNKLLQEQFTLMNNTKMLFKVEISGEELYNLYLKGFGEDEIFRDPESSIHTCNLCYSFVKKYANIVALDDDFNIMTIFDVVEKMNNDTLEEYGNSIGLMCNAVKSSTIVNVFFESFEVLKELPYEKCDKSQDFFQLGLPKNTKRYTKEEALKFGKVEESELRTFHHFSTKLHKRFVILNGKSVASVSSIFRSSKETFQKGMEEIPIETLELVRDLIKQGSLLNGDTHLKKLEHFLELKKQYDKIEDPYKDNWCWVMSYDLPIARFKNELIGVLCYDLAKNVDLNKACKDWNIRVDSVNYMKAVAPITEAQKRKDKKIVEDLGYIGSFNRRHATMDDINVEEIKYINSSSGEIKEASIFDKVEVSSKTYASKKDFSKIETVGIEKFMRDILPHSTSVELFLDKRFINNMVSMTTAVDVRSKNMFKWDNPFSFTFNGNLASKSEIKTAVVSQGGKVDGVLRFSIMWSEGKSRDDSDLDAHCIEPSNNEIYFKRKSSGITGGCLDIDITTPLSHKRNGNEVVENITYPSLEKMEDGSYRFFVRQYTARNSEGFRAEIDINGELYEYEFTNPVRGDIDVAIVTLKEGKFSIKHILPPKNSCLEIYGLKTQEFHKVNLVCLSPNHWGLNDVGNKHYMFMLEKAKVDNPIRTFHSEHLNKDLVETRKTLERLAAVTMIEPVDEQLSGVGFNATVRDEVIVKIEGTHKRIIKIKF